MALFPCLMFVTMDFSGFKNLEYAKLTCNTIVFKQQEQVWTGIIRMYRLVFASSCFFFMFCKDDSELLRLSKELSNFFMFHRETSHGHSCQSPALPPRTPNEHMTFLVDKIDM